jgi:hypothetical protein
MCPGGQGVCDACSNTACSTEGNACLTDVACAPCLEDPFREGCAENPVYMPVATCMCETCGQECIWLCPAAGNECAGCVSMSCSDAFGTCITDEACARCFENPSTEGCDANAEYAALTGCLCAADACLDVCEILFCTMPA